MKKITSITAVSAAALLSQTAAAHSGHHDDGLGQLLAHMSAHPDHWLAFAGVCAVAAGVTFLLRRRTASAGAKNTTR